MDEVTCTEDFGGLTAVVSLICVRFVPSVAEWSKALESDASAGGESPVRAPVRAATLCPYV